jgi:beta-ribofuranosylaminobenzene 5'-phosphate synthase
VTGVRLSQRLLQRLSGRGGASGIGINSFFKGGFLTDGGHNLIPSHNFAPSSAHSLPDIPPVICRISIPHKWLFYLVLPSGCRFSGGQEQKFFEQNTPIPKNEVLEVISLIYHGVVPAFLTNNLKLLKISLFHLHKTGFKKRELQHQSSNVKNVMRLFDNIPGCAVGMSSMGPLLYIVSNKKDEEVNKNIKNLCMDNNIELICTCYGRNRGFEVIK